MLQVLHNPRCGKSRNCLTFLTKKNVPYEIIKYIVNPLTVADLRVLLKKLALKPIDLVRQKETIWTENYKEKKMTDKDIINALAKYPVLIERPIVINGNKAIIGRDVNMLKEFI